MDLEPIPEAPTAEYLRAPRRVPPFTNRESRYPRDSPLGQLEDRLIEMFRENQRRQEELQRFRENRDSGRGDGSGGSH
uniref:Uncharacterized protein n=1 Tax=Timema bartmani TaxID=61472 RepID=A0A7R9F876_9NEOP|nr:unnamed protein product [Timema bartmani]